METRRTGNFMTPDTGSHLESQRLSRPRPAAWAAFAMLLAGGVVAAAAVVWGVAAPREPPDRLVQRVMCAGLAVALTGVAGTKFFWDAPRSRRPQWRRVSVVVALLGAAYMVVVAIRGM